MIAQSSWIEQNTKGIEFLAALEAYRDVYGLVTPHASNGTAGTGNGVMYTSEALLIADSYFKSLIKTSLYRSLANCLRRVRDGEYILTRSPSKQCEQEGPDDYYGILAFIANTGDYIWMARGLLKYLRSNRYNINNLDAGTCLVPLKKPRSKWNFFNLFLPQDQTINIKGFFFLVQPQLYVLLLRAADELYLWHKPLIWYAAICIFFSCRNVPKHDADSRRLSWLLIQGLRGSSKLFDLAAKGWYNRLFKDYGESGMKAVASYYYSDGHPFRTYWTS